MEFEDAVKFYHKKYGNHSLAAKAIGWEVRKYRDIRNQRSRNQDACRLLCLLAEKETREEK